MSSTTRVSVTLDVQAIEEIDHFTYLGSVVDAEGGTKANVKARIDKARMAFLQLKNIWKCQGCSSLQSRDIEDHNKEDTTQTTFADSNLRRNLGVYDPKS